jgi:hypothetical protein
VGCSGIQKGRRRGKSSNVLADRTFWLGRFLLFQGGTHWSTLPFYPEKHLSGSGTFQETFGPILRIVPIFSNFSHYIFRNFMPVIRVSLNTKQYAHVEKIANSASADAGDVIRALINLDMEKGGLGVKPEKAKHMPAHAMTILTNQDDLRILQLRDRGLTWPEVVQEIQYLKPDDTVSRGAVMRGYQRALKKSR